MELLVLLFIFFVFVCQIFKNLDTKRTTIHTCTLTADQGEAPLPEADAAALCREPCAPTIPEKPVGCEAKAMLRGLWA